jgi:hypothetical protein
MRTDEELRGRTRYLLSVELDRRVQLASKRLPHQCTHNYRHPVDVRKRVDGEPNSNYNRISLTVVQDQSIGLCTLGKDNPEEWNGTICEDPVDAQRCPYFQSKVTKEDLSREFQEQVEDMGWLERNLPEVYGLLWALSEPVKLPWWKRLWFWALRIRTEPLKNVPSLLERNDDSNVGL